MKQPLREIVRDIYHEARLRASTGESADLIEGGRLAAEKRGFQVAGDTESEGWSIEEAAPHLLSRLQELKLSDPERPACVVAPGSLPCTPGGSGKGGHNQAFVLHCVPLIAGRQIAILSASTSGIDGNGPAAGAVADGLTLARALALRMNPADPGSNGDAYAFFARLGDTILTGPREGNGGDLRLVICR